MHANQRHWQGLVDEASFDFGCTSKILCRTIANHWWSLV